MTGGDAHGLCACCDVMRDVVRGSGVLPSKNLGTFSVSGSQTGLSEEITCVTQIPGVTSAETRNRDVIM